LLLLLARLANIQTQMKLVGVHHLSLECQPSPCSQNSVDNTTLPHPKVAATNLQFSVGMIFT
jgi:hypothetical protein